MTVFGNKVFKEVIRLTRGPWGESRFIMRHCYKKRRLGHRLTEGWCGDCRHEIKRCVLLGRKVMTNLDNILKSRDVTLPTKVCLVKAMVFPVVMCGCEHWTIKKVEG